MKNGPGAPVVLPRQVRLIWKGGIRVGVPVDEGGPLRHDLVRETIASVREGR
jgi:hypothetical protein